MTTKFWTLSFSGAGHLLPYHLGVATTILKSNQGAKVRAVSGSSSGAIAATLFALLPDRLEEYADRFCKDGGRGIQHLESMLKEAESATKKRNRPALTICTTLSEKGTPHFFQFEDAQINIEQRLLPAVLASCQVPQDFHPVDVFNKGELSYAYGVEIDGVLHCDGGIASPAPPTPYDSDPNCEKAIVVSPISGSFPKPIPPNKVGIRPRDHSLSIPFYGDLTTRCGTFGIRPSLQNLRSAVASMGAINRSSLQTWFDLGQDDTKHFLESMD